MEKKTRAVAAETGVDSVKTALIPMGIGIVSTAQDLPTKIVGLIIIVCGVALNWMKYSKR